MNDLGGFIARVATATVVRRVVGLLLLAVLAWAGMGRAEAATRWYTYKGEAYEAAYAAADAMVCDSGTNPTVVAIFVDPIAAPNGSQGAWASRKRCRAWNNVNQAYYEYNRAPADIFAYTNVQQCAAGLTWNDTTKKCEDQRCAMGRDMGIWTPEILDDLSCRTDSSDGATCETAGIVGPDGYVHWYSTGETCTKPYECPPGWFSNGDGTCEKKPECGDIPYDLETNTCVKPEECPAGSKKRPDGSCTADDDSNCTAGQVKGPDGLCMNDPDKCSAGSAPDSTGTCKPDENDDGVPDEDDGTHKAIDSATCDKPPVCSGDEILCVHAMQLWRVDCNTRRNARVDLDAYCKRPPVCESVALGDDNRTAGCTQQEEAMIFLQWKTACAVAAMAEKDGSGDGDVDADANNNGQPDWTEDTGTGAEGVNLGDDDADGSQRAAVFAEGAEIGGSGFDSSGFGFVRACPTIPDVTVRGTVIHFNTGKFCEWVQLGGQFVLLMAALVSLRILTVGGLR